MFSTVLSTDYNYSIFFPIIVYRDDEGKPWVLPVVSSTEVALAADKTLNHEYLSIDGLKEFCTVATKLILGADSPALVQNRVCSFCLILSTKLLFRC